MHDHHHGGNHGHEHHHSNQRKRGIHKDWRAWVVVLLMLAALVGYVMTMDESIVPGGGASGQPMPAAEGPPAPTVAP